MRTIGLVTMSMWLSACSTTPMFPPAITKDVEANTFDVKACEDQAYHPSSAALAERPLPSTQAQRPNLGGLPLVLQGMGFVPF